MRHDTSLIVPEEEKVECSFDIHLPEDEVVPTYTLYFSKDLLHDAVELRWLDGTEESFHCGTDIGGIDLPSPLVVVMVS